MLTDKEIGEAAQQLADYRRNDTLKDILNTYEALLEKYRRLKSDYEEERDARERYKQLARGQERNPFVLVLVDADGYVFNDTLISAGADGGSQAAQLLNDNIKASLRRKGLEHCEAMVRVYANVAGLSKALSKAGLVGAEKRSLAPFIANFNRSYPHTDFVDAGELKENADFKLRGLLRLYAENAQCKHIFFAACHDAGYVSELTPYRNHRDRFTLIRTPGLYFHDEFNKLGLGVEELPGVFRPTGSAMDAIYPKPQQALSHNTNNNNSNNVILNKPTPPLAPSSPAASKTPLTGTGEFCQFYRMGKCRYGDHCKNMHINSQTSTLPIRNNSRLSRDWRPDTVTPTSDHNGVGIPTKPRENNGVKTYLQQADVIKQLPKKEDIPDGHVAVNTNQQRLDAYIQQPTTEAESRLKSRSAIQRLCNSKHLTGSCPNPKCEYDHGPLDEDLIPALEWLSRSLPCPRRSSCRNAECTSGHVCQKPDCKHRGGRAYCKLGWTMHFDNLAVDRFVPAVSKQTTNGDQDGSIQNTAMQSYSVHSNSIHSSPGPVSPSEDEEEEDGDVTGSGGILFSV